MSKKSEKNITLSELKKKSQNKGDCSSLCVACTKACNQNRCKFVEHLDKEHIPEGAKYEAEILQGKNESFKMIYCPDFEMGRSTDINNDVGAIALCEAIFKGVADAYVNATAYGSDGEKNAAARNYETFWGWDIIAPIPTDKERLIEDGKNKIKTRAKLLKEAYRAAETMVNILYFKAMDIVKASVECEDYKAGIEALKKTKGYVQDKINTLHTKDYLGTLKTAAKNDEIAQLVKTHCDKEYESHKDNRYWYMEKFFTRAQVLLSDKLLDMKKAAVSDG